MAAPRGVKAWIISVFGVAILAAVGMIRYAGIGIGILRGVGAWIIGIVLGVATIAVAGVARKGGTAMGVRIMKWILGIFGVLILIQFGIALAGQVFYITLAIALGLIVVLLLIALVMAKAGWVWRVMAIPGEAYVYTQWFGENWLVVLPGETIRNFPLMRRLASTVPLDQIEFTVATEHVLSKNNHLTSATSNVQITIATNARNMRQVVLDVARRFPGKSKGEVTEQIEAAAHQILEGHQSDHISNELLQRMVKDRRKFAAGVLELSKEQLKAAKIKVLSFTTPYLDESDKSTEEGDLSFLVADSRWQVERARLRAGVAQEATREGVGVRKIAANKEIAIVEAAALQETDPPLAAAHMAYELEQAKVQIRVAELVQDAETVVPADAERYAKVEIGKGDAEALWLKLEAQHEHPELAVVNVTSDAWANGFKNLTVYAGGDGGNSPVTSAILGVEALKKGGLLGVPAEPQGSDSEEEPPDGEQTARAIKAIEEERRQKVAVAA